MTLYNGDSLQKIDNMFQLLTIFAKQASSQMFDGVLNTSEISNLVLLLQRLLYHMSSGIKQISSERNPVSLIYLGWSEGNLKNIFMNLPIWFLSRTSMITERKIIILQNLLIGLFFTKVKCCLVHHRNLIIITSFTGRNFAGNIQIIIRLFKAFFHLILSEIFKSTYFEEHLQTAASVLSQLPFQTKMFTELLKKTLF